MWLTTKNLGGNCPGGNCPGVIVWGVIVWGVIVLEPLSGQLPPRQLPPDNYPQTNTPRTITPLGQILPGHLPPLRNFSSTYLGILCTYILHFLFFLEEPNIHFMFHIINHR